MKKLISTLLAVFMVTSIFNAMSFAANDTTDMQKILTSVKERVTVPENLSVFDYNTQSNGNVTQYYFNWSTKDKTKNDNMSVTCDATGVITGYHYFSQDDMNYKNDPSFPKISREDAKQYANEFIEKINPNYCSQIKVLDEVSSYDTPLYSNSHNFNVIRTVNDVEFMDNSGNISVDSDSGKVTDFNIQWWSGVSFADKNKVLTSEEAIKAYNDKLGLKLVYKAASDGEKKTVYPVYIRTDNNKFIDANTGEIFEREYGIYRFNSKSASMSAGGRGMDTAAQFTPEEIEKINEISGLISPADAEKIIRSNKYIAVSKAAKVNSSNLNKDNYMADGYIYNLYFEDGDNSWNAALDAKTGAILSFYKYNNKQPNTDLNVSKEKAEKTALQVMKDIMGDKYTEYKFSDDYTNGTVNFTRIVNGIEYVNNAGSVSVDNNGGIINFNYSYTDDEFPAIDGVMTKEQALQYLIKDNFNLYYVGENRSDKSGWGEPTDKARLVYTTESTNDCINPFTGEFLDYNGKPVKDNSVKEYTDIKGHYAEKQIEALAKSGVGFEGDKFLPDQPILQKEYIALLMSVFNRWTGPIPLYDTKIIDQAYQQASSMGVITEEEKNSDAVVTRESAAKFFIRAMGIDKYASLENIYNCPFPDVTKYKGHISILYALGVVSGDNNGNFNPDSVLSRADASILIYNYLNK